LGAGAFTLLGAVIAAAAGFGGQLLVDSRRRSEKKADEDQRFKAASRLVCADLDGAIRVIWSAYQDKSWQPHGHPPTDGWTAMGDAIASTLTDEELSTVVAAMRQIVDVWGYTKIWGGGALGLGELETLATIHGDLLPARQILHPTAYPTLYGNDGVLLITPAFLELGARDTRAENSH
jgi:hypothetical protein